MTKKCKWGGYEGFDWNNMNSHDYDNLYFDEPGLYERVELLKLLHFIRKNAKELISQSDNIDPEKIRMFAKRIELDARIGFESLNPKKTMDEINYFFDPYDGDEEFKPKESDLSDENAEYEVPSELVQ